MNFFYRKLKTEQMFSKLLGFPRLDSELKRGTPSIFSLLT